MYHQTTIIGHIGQDPETKYLPSGLTVTEWSVAVNERFKKKDGSKGEHTEWYNCRAYGKLAELIAEYRKKGDLVFCQGRMRTDKWEKEGEPRSRTYLNVQESRGLGGTDHASKPAGDPGASTPTSKAKADDDFDDDIPF